MERLKKRRDFMKTAKGRRFHTGLFSLQYLPRGDEAPPRAGFTVTKKVGGAVERNRIRRRLKEAVRLAGSQIGAQGHDYVLIARREVLAASFADIRSEIARAFARDKGAARQNSRA